jgi:3-polyprenyl-4-hydroxybenzoate decarboxylase
VDGPVDQLDHSAIRDSYGGKIGIDATRKPNMALAAGSSPLLADQITAVVGDRWHSWCDAVLLVGVDKAERSVRATFDALWAVCPGVNLVALDAGIDLRDLSNAAWRTLGNVDWRRDIVIRGGPVDHFAADDGAPRGQIGIDATTKGPEDGHPRGWPDEIEMSAAVKALVDQKWEQYGIA